MKKHILKSIAAAAMAASLAAGCSLAGLTALAAGSSTSASRASAGPGSEIMVYKNGNIYTSDSKQNYVSAIVVQNGKFIYVGDDEGAAAYEKGIPAENVVDLGGKIVTAGYIEGHTHFTFMAAMNSLGYIEIASNLTLQESLDEVKKFVAEHPDYDQYALGNFSQAFDLDKTQLDKICADKPLICVGMGLHCGYVNSAFLKAGGIDKNTKDAVPGESYYKRDAEGNPTGKIVELTQTWIAFEKAIKIDQKKLKEEILKMQDLYHSYGFIGYAEGGYLGLNEENMLKTYTELEKEGSLQMIVCPASIWYGSNVSSLEELKTRALKSKNVYTSELIRPGTVKMWADGTIGAYSALMTEDYVVNGVDKGHGVQLNTVEDLTACAKMCQENDLNIHYHAIGNKAVENVLTAFESVGETNGTKSMVHFTISTPELIQRAAKIKGLIVNMTPTWGNIIAKEEVDPVSKYRESYGLFKEAMDAGITVNFGADSNGTKECWNPSMMIMVATIRNPEKEGLFLKGKPCTFEEGVDAYTINVAKERNIDREYGSIEVGKNACFCIWNVSNLENVVHNLLTGSDLPITDNELVYADQVFFNGSLVFDHRQKD